PPGGAEAPAVTGLEAGEAVGGHRRAEVVALLAREREELRGDPHADGVVAAIGAVRVAAAVPEVTGQGSIGAGQQGAAQHVLRIRQGTTTGSMTFPSSASTRIRAGSMDMAGASQASMTGSVGSSSLRTLRCSAATSPRAARTG